MPRSEPQRRRPPGARRAALLDILRSHDRPLTVAEVAPLAGLHPNTVRAHLDVLVRTGEVSRRTEARNTPGRPRELYEATGAASEDRNYQLLAQVLATRLAELTGDAAGAAVDAGRRWVEHAPPEVRPTDTGVEPVMRLLRASGFAPELTEDGSEILLHHCPFRELAEVQRDVVCGTHLGLIQGALEQAGSDVRATRLLPFVQPDLCVTSLVRSRDGQ